MSKTRIKLKKNELNRGETGNYCEIVLGDGYIVSQFADFNDSHLGHLELIQEQLFNETWKGTEYSREELTAYKKGLGDVLDFFAKCSIEIENRIEERKEK